MQSTLVTPPQLRFSNVLVGVDGSPTGRDAIALGEWLRDPRRRLTLAHVVLSQAPTFRNFHATPAWTAARELLERERRASRVQADLTGMASSSVGSGLHQLVADHGADLLVVGSCRRGIGRMLLGNDTRRALTGARCAVAIAPRGYAEKPAGDLLLMRPRTYGLLRRLTFAAGSARLTRFAPCPVVVLP